MNIFTIKQMRAISLQILALLLPVVFGSPQLVWGQEVVRNNVTITSPKEGDQVDKRIVVKGTSEIHDGSQIWVFSSPINGNQWLPQQKPIVDENGNWQALVSPPEKGGFKILAATFNLEVAKEIQKIRNSINEDATLVGISLPETTSNKAIVTVKRN
jgi:hypothetical protein